MSYVYKVKLLSERTSGVPPVIFDLFVILFFVIFFSDSSLVNYLGLKLVQVQGTNFLYKQGTNWHIGEEVPQYL